MRLDVYNRIGGSGREGVQEECIPCIIVYAGAQARLAEMGGGGR